MPTRSTHFHIRSSYVRFALVLLLLLSALPGGVLAAPGAEMDPDVRIQAEQAATQVGLVLSGSGSAQTARPNQETPPRTPTAGGAGIEYSAPGVTLTAPANWIVERASDDLFTLSVPGKLVYGFMDQESSDEFPGVFAIVLFEQQSELLAASMGEEIALEGVSRFQTNQGLPALNISFGGNMEGMDMGGSMYIVAAGDATYMLLILSTADLWTGIQADADAIAASISAESPSLMVTADDGDMDYISQDGTASLVVPAGWQVQDIDDDDISILVVDPTMSFVAAGTWEPTVSIEDATDLALYDALLSGAIASEEEEAVLDLLINFMSFGEEDSEFVPDKASTALLGDADFPVLRMAATMMSDDFEMPMITYVQATEAGLVGLVVIGNQDRILDSEEILIDILKSVVFQ